MITLAIDAMGGDFAPKTVIQGTIEALIANQNLNIYLYGIQSQIEDCLQNIFTTNILNSIKTRLKIINTPLYLPMNAKNIREAIRDNLPYSMLVALKDTANSKTSIDSFITAGPTQSLVLASYLIIGTLPSIKRISLALMFKSIDHRTRILTDAGANAEIKEENILDFVVCANFLAQTLLHIPNPKIKLLNIGTESNKGRNIDINIFKLLSNNPNINFQGNEEPNNFFNTEADILISDGFTANMILKTFKGTVEMYKRHLKQILTSNLCTQIISKIFLEKNIKKHFQQFNTDETGGAILLGLNKLIIKAPGNSTSNTFYQTINQTINLIKKNFLKKIIEKFQ
ncbi:phosphate acyltransferase [Candidatus Phytoplasma asiaticum]|uniref:Phosphate acyltransferase n=1 Tax=Candidatus Phytoplasma asiaticum TaxID=2763338 RepID=A0AAX3B975_9MOLU|nr:phosphate acyltransferase ['Parthenium hysterophorus' phyllody phytoplasma]UQV27246.1 phosphate acyltransferase ['Parthenium hysterophorus' phyllody phytoplasma]